MEGLRARACRQARGRGGGPRHARRGRAKPDLRRRGRRDRLAARRAATRDYEVPLPAPGEPKRAILDSYTKEHSAEYQSQALIDLAFRMRGEDRRSATDREDHHPHQPPHARRDRHRRQRSAEDGPEGQPRDAGPLDHVHLRRRAAGRPLAPRATATRRGAPARRHRRALAQDRDARGPGVGAALSSPPTRSSRRSAAASMVRCRTERHRRRDGGGQRASARRQARSARPDYIRKFRDADRRHHLDPRGEPLPGGWSQDLPR